MTAWLGRRRDAAVVLSYHNVIGNEPARGERVLHTPVARFREQLERATARLRIVPLAELLRRRRDGRPLRGLAAVTFDDAYRGVLRHAVPVLAELGIPATVFVVAGALERHVPFWWDRVAESAGGVVPGRDRLLHECGGDEDRVLAASAPHAAPLGDDYLPATAGDLAARDADLLAIGLHTMTHPNLTRIPAARLAEEIGESWSVLRERFGAVVPAMAYPYGLVDDAVAAEATGQGLAGFGGPAGSMQHRHAAGCLPRLFVNPAMHPDALEAAAAGLRG
jgi:peptidoglycan/xylan/chitin deacetylase (PgdA/CDA1 family)